jgi:hypothetical protein
MKPGIYEHFKGGRYRLLMVAKHSETEEEMVVYFSFSSGLNFVRPLSMWNEIVEWPNGEKKSRFILVLEDEEGGVS